MERRCMGLFLLLLLVLAPQEVVEGYGGRMCESQSHKYKGMCIIGHNCDVVCKHEGFKRGMCKGFRRRCMCIKTCGEQSPPGEQPSPPGEQPPPPGEWPPPPPPPRQWPPPPRVN